MVLVSLALLLLGCGGTTEQATETAAETSTETAEESTTAVTITETEEETVSATQQVLGEEGADVEEMVVAEEGETTAEETTAETEEETAAAEAVPQTVEVNIQNYAYDDAALTIKAGDTVVWTNYDSAPHTVTATSGADFDSGTLSQGSTWEYTFTEQGTYEYKCSIHPSMTGTVVVE